MASPTTTNTWSDRRGLFQRGKEVPDPAKPRTMSGSGSGGGGEGVIESIRRTSTSSSNRGATGSPVEKTMSNTSTGSAGGGAAGRRRSSQSQGLYHNLQTHKRGSADYGERRASWAEMQGSGGGVMSGWFNKTFRGVQGPGAAAGGAAGGADAQAGAQK